MGGGVPDAGGPTPTATPTATPGAANLCNVAGGPSTDCSDFGTEPVVWRDTSTGSTTWTDGGTDCEAIFDANFDEAAVICDTANTTTTEFCSWKAIQLGTDNIGLGCSFRGQSGTDDHYYIAWGIRFNSFNFENHEGGGGHGFVNSVDVQTYCTADCDDEGAWVDPEHPGWYGIKLSGTGTSTTAQWWILDSDNDGTLDSNIDEEDPSTWTGGANAGDMVCECLATEFDTEDETWTTIDSAGDCGLEATSNIQNPTPNITSFACGDYTP
jgi:hypothetical protein